MSFELIIGAWVATGLTLFIFTFLYKDNPLFKLAENLYVGVSVGYTIVKTYDTVIVHLVWKPIVENGEWALLIPVAIGMLMLTRYVPKAAWISRYAFAFIVGVGSGLAIPRTISSFILKQIEDTVRPLIILPFDVASEIIFSSRMALAFTLALFLALVITALYFLVRLGVSKLSGMLQLMIAILAVGGAVILKYLLKLNYLKGATWLLSYLEPITQVFDINSLVVLLGVSCVLFYFFFSVEHTGPGKIVARTGIIFLMIAFGAAFGYTVMARMSLLIGRLTDLIEFTDPSYGRPSLWLVGLTILTLVVMSRRSNSKQPKEEEK
jgi:hypothetical protein